MAAKILVVDDEPHLEALMTQRLRRKIKADELDLVFALNGEEALEIVHKESDIDMVLTDINMPKMDGLTLLSKLKEIRPLLKTVIVSAYGDMENIRRAMNNGAFDFLTKPIEFEDLETTIDKTLQEVALIKKTEALEERTEQLETLDQLKTEFFHNISHEFRTPLTVIYGMTDQIEEMPEYWLEKGLHAIRRNTHTLLDLVNQILELSKLEAGAMPVHYIQSDIMGYLLEIFELFQSLAESKEIQMHYLANESEKVMDYDSEKLLRILSNLLNNAIKYTDPGGHVYFQVDPKKDTIQIRVRDTGKGIAAEQIPHLFERFYQADSAIGSKEPGTGIGLSLVGELAALLDASIEVDSTLGQGSTFTLTLPITNEAPVREKGSIGEAPRPFMVSGEEGGLEEEATDLPLLLIVEDNEEVGQFLKQSLHRQYRIDWQKDGQAGIDRALEAIPDIIISDVMMPKKDGFELCQTLKQEERTSHIPIILLTARADTESRISGLEQGADAYLAKPFSRKELMVRLEQLLKIRAKLQARYGGMEGIPASDDPAFKREDQFVIRLREEITANLEDENFGISELSRAIGLSRAQIHRKITALTGQSTSTFIRSIRLQKAKELLHSSDLNISQIAYEVGFRDPKYFSRVFSKAYGMPPNEARK